MIGRISVYRKNNTPYSPEKSDGPLRVHNCHRPEVCLRNFDRTLTGFAEAFPTAPRKVTVSVCGTSTAPRGPKRRPKEKKVEILQGKFQKIEFRS